MKLICSLVLLGAVLGGCAVNTVEKRRTERLSAYKSLTQELKAMVDKGQIKVGMSEDAVYIAWGAPSQVVQREDKDGFAAVWLYQGMLMQETQQWKVRWVGGGGGGQPFLERYLDHDYNPRDYIRAEITMTNGAVASWRTLPEPLH